MVTRRKRRIGKREVKENISREEMRRVIEKLKDRKAMGLDGVPNEVWKCEGGWWNMVEWVWRICRRSGKGRDGRRSVRRKL